MIWRMVYLDTFSGVKNQPVAYIAGSHILVFGEKPFA